MANALILVLKPAPPAMIALVKFTLLAKILTSFSEMLKGLNKKPMMEPMLMPMQVLKVMVSSADSIAFFPDTHTEQMCGVAEQQFKS
jgi:hypothetical protein